MIFGFISRKNIARSNGVLGGEGLATAGLIIGFVNVGLVLIAIVTWLIIVIVAGQSTNSLGAILPSALSLL